MKRCFFTRICTGLLLLAGSQLAMAQPTPAAVAAFNAYASTVESRLAQQHQSDDAFLAPTASDRRAETARLRSGEYIVERLTPAAGAEVSGSLLHHWRGTAFVPGATAAISSG
jgi:hypothetical protein